MKKLLLIMSIIMLTLQLTAQDSAAFYKFSFKSLDGSTYYFNSLKGKKVMIVNTASKCGYTPQYKSLEALYQQYKSKNFIIIGFPANNFLWQEPGTNAEIKDFCSKNYGVSFPMMEKISVKGKNMDALYHWLTEKALNGIMNAPVKWNFQKFMIDESGKLSAVFPSSEDPLSDNIRKWIEGN